MVPYIDDSHIGGWKKLPSYRHIRSMSYHPSLRSNLSSLGLELPHKQFDSLEDHESSFAERYCKLLQLVYCRSKPCQQSPSKQRSPCSSNHPPRIAKINNNRVNTRLLKSLCRVLVVKSYQGAKPGFLHVRLRRSQELRPHLIREHLAVWGDPPGQGGC